MTENL